MHIYIHTNILVYNFVLQRHIRVLVAQIHIYDCTNYSLKLYAYIYTYKYNLLVYNFVLQRHIRVLVAHRRDLGHLILGKVEQLVACFVLHVHKIEHLNWVCMYVCMYVCASAILPIYIYIYTHTHTHALHIKESCHLVSTSDSAHLSTRPLVKKGHTQHIYA